MDVEYFEPLKIARAVPDSIDIPLDKHTLSKFPVIKCTLKLEPESGSVLGAFVVCSR